MNLSLKDFLKSLDKKENTNVVIDTESVQYKALVKRLEKYDNDKTDAIRLALLYLEDKGKTLNISSIEQFIK